MRHKAKDKGRDKRGILGTKSSASIDPLGEVVFVRINVQASEQGGDKILWDVATHGGTAYARKSEDPFMSTWDPSLMCGA
jgi:hypothetical protein